MIIYSWYLLHADNSSAVPKHFVKLCSFSIVVSIFGNENSNCYSKLVLNLGPQL